MQEDPKMNHANEAPEEESNAAKLLRVRGGDTEDRIHDEAAVVQDYNKAQNFWYHYKWPVIFVAIILVAALIMGAQTLGRVKEDMAIMYVGPYYMVPLTEPVKEAFGFITEDYNEDGEVAFKFAALHCYSDEQILALQEQEDENGNKMDDLTYSMIAKANAEEKESFYQLVFLDEFAIWLMDPYFYEDVRKVDGFLPLSEIFDYEVEAAIDETGIRFMDTAFAQYYECFAELPEDTVLCLRRLSTVAGKSGKKMHADSIEMFRTIVEFQPEE